MRRGYEGEAVAEKLKNESAVRQVLPLFVQACISMHTRSLDVNFPSLSSFILVDILLGSYSTLGMHGARTAGLTPFPALSIFKRRAKLFIHCPRIAVYGPLVTPLEQK